MHQIARPEAGRKHRPGKAPPVLASPFRIVNRARRNEYPRHTGKWCGVKPAKWRRCFLQFEPIAFACYRQTGQRRARSNDAGVDSGQQAGVIGRFLLRMRHLARQALHQPGFALGRLAGFKGIVMVHGKPWNADFSVKFAPATHEPLLAFWERDRGARLGIRGACSVPSERFQLPSRNAPCKGGKRAGGQLSYMGWRQFHAR